MRFPIMCAALAATLLSCGAPAHASILGVAGDFNGFVFGNLSSAGQDTEGRLAVGGNFTASNYGVGSGGVGPALPNSHGTRDDLIVDGNMNAIGGWQVFYGNAVWGTGLTAAPTTPNGTTFHGTPIDFAAAQADLTSKSEYWATLPTNASVVFDGYSTLTLTATNAGLNVFNVPENFWEDTSSKQIVNPFPNATLLINILGTDITQSGGLSFNGTQTPSAAHSNVLFNYASATTLLSSNIGVLGSLLAPHAALTIDGGGINGNGIAASVLQQNGGEFHNFTFSGELPHFDPAPEPTTAAIFAIGAMCALCSLRRRRD